MSIDHSDAVGFPAPATRVYQDRTRIFPRCITEHRRQQMKEANQRYYYGPKAELVAQKACARMKAHHTGPNRERYLALRRASERALREAARLPRTAASGGRAGGCMPEILNISVKKNQPPINTRARGRGCP